MKLPPSMTPKEYKKWLSNPCSRFASLPSFFESGADRTYNVLKGKALKKSVLKRKSFGYRHYSSYLENPTEKRRLALKNWGFAVPKSPLEKKNVKCKGKV